MVSIFSGGINVFRFWGGLFLFFSGLQAAKKNLNKLASPRIKRYLTVLSRHNLVTLITGIVITAFLQSSSAVAVILISLLDTGYIKLKTAALIMLGANLGTTITVQLISLPFSINSLSYILIILSLVLFLLNILTQKNLYRYFLLVLSLASIFLGLNFLASFLDQSLVKSIIIRLLPKTQGNILIYIVVGMMATAFIQSSSALSSIVVLLGHNQLLTLPMAAALIVGSNLGTCITAFLACLKSSCQARLLAVLHLCYNIIGVILILPFYNIFVKIINYSAQNLNHQIANVHTFFNLITIVFIFIFYIWSTKILKIVIYD